MVGDGLRIVLSCHGGLRIREMRIALKKKVEN